MLRHFIHTDDLSIEEIKLILTRAGEESLFNEKRLQNKKFITIFFENSTRTLSSFDIAIKNLGGKVVRLDVAISSAKKGETIADTAANLNAMNPDSIIIRHGHAGAPNFLKNYVSCPIINAGDGAHAHPTQAMLDLYTIANYYDNNIKNGLKKLKGKTIAIIGDIRNSRVANSNIELLSRFGLNIILVAPPHFLSSLDYNKSNISFSDNLESIVKHADILMSLRTQTERHEIRLYGSLQDYAHRFCIKRDVIGDKDLIILHPGPVHRNIDISDDVLNDKRCLVLTQVQNGVKVRMALMEFFAS